MRWTNRWTPTLELAQDLDEMRRQVQACTEDGGESLEAGTVDWLIALWANAKASQAKLQLREVSCRVARSRFLLRPGKINRLVHGCLAKAQQRAPGVRICAYAFMSTHYHMLVITPDAPTLSRFMNLFQSALAKEANRLHGWTSRFWSSRYTSTLVSDEPQVQLERLRYVLSQGCKENLVASPLDWPGATSHGALMNGYDAIEGDWINRTELFLRRKGGERALAEGDVTERLRVQLAKLPAFGHLSRLEHAAIVKREIRDIEQATRERHKKEGTRPLGAANVLAAHPHSLPEKTKQSPKPKFHATKEIFKALCAAYRAFLEVFGAAADRMGRGEEAVFPEGCFPPALPPRSTGSLVRPRAPG